MLCYSINSIQIRVLKLLVNMTEHEKVSTKENPSDLFQAIEKRGLDGAYFVKIFQEKLGVKQASALRFLKPVDVQLLCDDLKRDWEKDALRALISDAKREHEDERGDNRHKQIQGQLKAANELITNVKEIAEKSPKEHDAHVEMIQKELTNPVLTMSNICEHMNGELAKWKQTLPGISNQVASSCAAITDEDNTAMRVRRNIPHGEILAHASAGLAMQGSFPKILHHLKIKMGNGDT